MTAPGRDEEVAWLRDEVVRLTALSESQHLTVLESIAVVDEQRESVERASEALTAIAEKHDRLMAVNCRLAHDLEVAEADRDRFAGMLERLRSEGR